MCRTIYNVIEIIRTVPTRTASAFAAKLLKSGLSKSKQGGLFYAPFG